MPATRAGETVGINPSKRWPQNLRTNQTLLIAQEREQTCGNVSAISLKTFSNNQGQHFHQLNINYMCQVWENYKKTWTRIVTLISPSPKQLNLNDNIIFFISSSLEDTKSREDDVILLSA